MARNDNVIYRGLDDGCQLALGVYSAILPPHLIEGALLRRARPWRGSLSTVGIGLLATSTVLYIPFRTSAQIPN